MEHLLFRLTERWALFGLGGRSHDERGLTGSPSTEEGGFDGEFVILQLSDRVKLGGDAENGIGA